MQDEKASRAPAERESPWLRSPRWDGFWLLSGIWLLAPALAYSTFPGTIRIAFVVATLLLWLAHRFATAFTAYCTPSFRGLVALEWRRFLLGPLVIFVAVFVVLFVPEDWIGVSFRWRVLLLGTVFFLYNAYHFSAQHFGVLSVYRVRAGGKGTALMRRLDKAYCLLVTGVAVSVAQILHGAFIVDDTLAVSTLASLPLRDWLTTLRPVAVGALVGSTALVAALDGPVSPRQLYRASIAAQGLAAYFLTPPAFLLLWAVQHWLVSVGLSAHMAGNAGRLQPTTTTTAARSLWYRSWAPVAGHFWGSVFLLCTLSVLLTPLFEIALHPERHGVAPLWNDALVAKILVGLAFGSVFTHFLLDRAVFRLSDPRVRRITGRLLFGASPS